MAPSTWRRRPTHVGEEVFPGEAAWWLHRCLSHLCVYQGWMAPCGSGGHHHPCRLIRRLCRPRVPQLIGHYWATAVVLLLDGVFLLWLRLPSPENTPPLVEVPYRPILDFFSKQSGATTS